MKTWIFWAAAILSVAWRPVVHAQDFDAKLKRFVTIADGKYAPEISCDEAVKLGFTVNDYKRFVRYVEQLNVDDGQALTLPENLFWTRSWSSTAIRSCWRSRWKRLCGQGLRSKGISSGWRLPRQQMRF